MSMPIVNTDSNAAQAPSGDHVVGTYCVEIMLSAGARKHAQVYNSPAYRELGEDVAGLFSLPRYTVFWLADGTGDEPTLPQFSPRILAQDAGACLLASARERLMSDSGRVELSILLSDMLIRLRNVWQARITKLWEHRRSDENIDQYLQMFSTMGDGSKQIGWSSVFIAGLLHHGLAQLDCVSWGDAGCLVQTMDQQLFQVPPTSSRLWVSLQSDDKGAEVPQATVGPETVTERDIMVFSSVAQFLCLSDGNYRMPLESLFKRQGNAGVANLARVVKGLRQDTYDDRSLVLGTYITSAEI